MPFDSCELIKFKPGNAPGFTIQYNTICEMKFHNVIICFDWDWFIHFLLFEYMKKCDKAPTVAIEPDTRFCKSLMISHEINTAYPYENFLLNKVQICVIN